MVLLTPREAALLSDQILEPSDFPWQGSESQVIAFEVKSRIKNALTMQLSQEVEVIGQVIVEKDLLARQREAMGIPYDHENDRDPEDDDA